MKVITIDRRWRTGSLYGHRHALFFPRYWNFQQANIFDEPEITIHPYDVEIACEQYLGLRSSPDEQLGDGRWSSYFGRGSRFFITFRSASDMLLVLMAVEPVK